MCGRAKLGQPRSKGRRRRMTEGQKRLIPITYRGVVTGSRNRRRASITRTAHYSYTRGRL